MGAKSRKRQISKNNRNRRIAALMSLMKRFNLKKLAAGGLLASALFLMGESGSLDSIRLFAESPAVISGTVTSGYDGAVGSNSLFLNAENGTTLTSENKTYPAEEKNTGAYYQNLNKITGLGDLTIKGVAHMSGTRFLVDSYAIVTNVDQIHVNGSLTLDTAGFIGMPNYKSSGTTARSEGSGYSVGSLYVGGDLTCNGGLNTNYQSGITAENVVVEGYNVKLGENCPITTTDAFWAATRDSNAGDYAKITLDSQAKLNVGGTLTFRDIVCGGTVNAWGYTSGETVVIDGGTVNFDGSRTDIAGRDTFGIKNYQNLNSHGSLNVAMSLENYFKSNLYGETCINGTLINTGKEVGDEWVKAELLTNGNVSVNMKPCYENKIENSGIWNSTGEITSEASLVNSGTLTTTGSVSFSEQYDKTLPAYVDGKRGGDNVKGYVGVTVKNAGELNIGGALTSATGFTNSGTAYIGSNLNLTGALTNSKDLTTEGSVNLVNQGERTVAYMGKKGVGQNTTLNEYSYYWTVDEYLAGNVENSGKWTSNSSISTEAAVNNSGTLTVTGNLITIQDNEVYTVKNYQNTSGQDHLQESGTVTGLFDSQITNTGDLSVSGSVTAAGGFENSKTAHIGRSLDVTGKLSNAEGATLTTDGNVAVVSGGTRDVLSSKKKTVTFTTKEAYKDGETVKYRDKTETFDVDEWSVSKKDLTGSILNAGIWNANGTISVDNSLSNSGTLNANGTISVDNSLSNSGTLNANGAVSVADSFTNSGKADLKSALNAKTLKNEADSTLTTGGTVTVSDTTTNNGIWNANGNVSGQTVNNTGTINAAHKLAAASDLTNDGTINGTANGASLQVDGDLKSSGSGKGTISGLSALAANGTITKQDITMAGNYSTLEAGALTNSSVKNVGNLKIDGDGSLSFGDKLEGSGYGSTITVKGNLSGTGTASVSNFDNIYVGKDLSVDVTGIQNKSVMTVGGSIDSAEVSQLASLYVTGDLLGTALLSNIHYVNVGGDVKDTVSGTGIGSMFVAGDVITSGEIVSDGSYNSIFQAKSIANSGNIKNFSKVILTGDMSNTGDMKGTGAGSVIQSDSLTNDKTITAYDDIDVTGKVTNNENGTIELSGNLIANEVENKNTITVGGDLVIAEREGAAGETGLTNGEKAVLTVYGDLRDAGNLTNSGTIGLAGSGIVSENIVNNTGAEINGLTSSSTLQVTNGSVKNDGAMNNLAGIDVQNNTLTNNGTITGRGEDSVLKAQVLDNNGDIANYGTVTVAGKLTNDGEFTGTGKDSLLKASELENKAEKTISEYETVSVTGNLTNNGTLAGTGKDSVLKAASLVNTSVNTLKQFEKVELDTLENTGKMTGTGSGSLLQVKDDLKNTNEIADYESVIVGGNANVSGTITGTGANSAFKTKALYGADDTSTFTGTITNFEKFENGSDLTNAGTISGSGYYALLNLTGDLTNSNTIDQFQTVSVSQKLTNNGALTGMGAESQLTTGELENNAGKSITKFQEITVADKAVNAGTITGTGAGSKYMFKNGLENNAGGEISNVETIAVNGNANNAGIMTGTGYYALLNLTGDLTNSNTIDQFQTVSVSGKLSNDGTLTGMGAESQLTAGELENNAGKSITQFQEITVADKAVNAGTITGTGAGSKYTFSGGLENNAGGEISDVETIIVNGNAKNAGTLDVVSTVTVNDGNFTNDGGTLNLAIEKGQIGAITVNDGSAAVNGGTANIDGTQNMKYGDKYVFLSADKGLDVNTELDIQTEKQKLFSAKADYNDNSYWITMVRDHEYGNLPGLTPNQHNVGQYIDHLSYTLLGNDVYNNSDLYTVLGALDDSGAENAAYNLEQLSGSSYADQGLMGMQNTWFAHQNLANFVRPTDCENDPIYEEELLGKGAWGGFVGNSGNYKSDGNGLAHTYDSAGMIVGYDFFRSSNIRGGGYFQYQNVGISNRGVTASSDSDHYDLGLYGLYQKEIGYLLASGNLSYGNYKTDRFVAFGGDNKQIARSHEGNRDSFQQSLRLEAAPTFAVGWGNALIHPFVGLTYIHMSLDDVTESGSDKYVTALHSAGSDLNSLRPELGVRANACYEVGLIMVGLNTRASWVHEYCDTQATIQNQFSNPSYTGFGDSGSSFSITSTDIGRDYAWLGVGLTADTQSNWTFTASYDALVNGSAKVHTGSLGGSYCW